jgi:hypothetical protein
MPEAQAQGQRIGKVAKPASAIDARATIQQFAGIRCDFGLNEVGRMKLSRSWMISSWPGAVSPSRFAVSRHNWSTVRVPSKPPTTI